MKAKTEKFTINLEINGRKIVLTNVVWNNKTGQYIGYDSDAEKYLSPVGIIPRHYDISIYNEPGDSAIYGTGVNGERRYL